MFLYKEFSKKETPDFEIRVRALKHEPDMFYVNKNLKYIEDKLAEEIIKTKITSNDLIVIDFDEEIAEISVLVKSNEEKD